MQPTPQGPSRFSTGLAIACLVVAAWTAVPGLAQLARVEKATVSAQSGRTSWAAGSEAEILVTMEIEEGWHTNSSEPTYDYLIATGIEVEQPPEWPPARVSYPAGEMKSFAFAEEEISVYEGRVVMAVRQPIPDSAETGTVPIGIALTYQACDDRSCLPPVTRNEVLELVIGEEGEMTAAAGALGSVASSAGPAAPNLLWMLLLGAIGGLILNAMPCVLPVLSLKVFGLVKSAGQGRRHVVGGALATSAGILISFWALAALAILARSGGAAVGWGVQFQEPTFVAALAIIVVLFCLNLWGVFEVPLPASLANAAGAARGEGAAGHFTSGLFATLMATPCSAPFLGTAIGFALAQSPGTILAVFTAVGIGMASPYLALAAAPRSAEMLPRPGPWMDHLRISMGFLLAGAVIWLLYVLSAQISAERLAFFQIALLLMALLIWWRQAVLTRPGWRKAGLLAVLAAIVLSLALVNGDTAGATRSVGSANRLIEWSTFDRAQAERLANDGRLVFVDVTADWCFTCKVNERLALETEDVARVFAEHDVVAMKADWTNRSDEITRFLAHHGRYGIPFYLLYRPGEEPHLFGELITSREIVEVVEASGEAGTRLSSF